LSKNKIPAVYTREHRGKKKGERRVLDKLFFMGGFHEGDPCPGQIKEKRKLKKKGKNIIITV